MNKRRRFKAKRRRRTHRLFQRLHACLVWMPLADLTLREFKRLWRDHPDDVRSLQVDPDAIRAVMQHLP